MKFLSQIPGNGFKGIFGKLVIVLEISTVTVTEISVGQILGFHLFPKNIVRRFLSVTSLMIFSLGTKLTFTGNTRIFFLQSRAPRKFILKIFTEYFSREW